MKAWQKIFLGMVLGVIAGLLLGEHAKHLKILGDIFVRLIGMIIIPLIFFSLVSAITGMDDVQKAGRMGIKSFLLYVFTTMFAITIGLGVGNFVGVGEGITITIEDTKPEAVRAEPPGAAEMFMRLIPGNPFKAMAEGDVLQIVVFAILIGVAIQLSGAKGRKVAGYIDEITEVIFTLTGLVMKYVPVAVFGLLAWIVGTQDSAVVWSLLSVVGVVFAACVIHVILVYGVLILSVIGRVNPWHFFRKLIPAQLVAFSTSSSAAALPITMNVVQRQLGVSRSTSSFVMPLGTTINMDGTALYQGVTVLFVANAMGYTLGFGDYIVVVMTATLASIGSAGVPGAGFIMLSLVLNAVGLPLEGATIIAGIDRVLDMIRTTVNVTGDAAISVIMDKSEGHFDEVQYQAEPSIEKEAA